MSDASVPPRDDRTWPEGAFAFSLAVGGAALVSSAALVAAAGSVGRALELLFVFGLVCALQAVAAADALRPWLRGQPLPRRSLPIEVALGLLVCATFLGGPDLGGAGLCGLLVGFFLPNASSIRYARVNRSLATSDETPLASDPAHHLDRASDPEAPDPDGPDPDAPVRQTRQARTRAVPKVGPVLREKLAEDRDRALAWLAATLTVVVVSVAAGGTTAELLAVTVVGIGALGWVCRRLVGGWIALGDFEAASHVPRRAFVVMVRDKNPRVRRPLLGVWSNEPVATGGQLPPAEAVYRCDDKRDALISTKGTTIVHEAWLDTGSRDRAMPRWVAADGGVALPRRPAFLGRSYLSSLVATDRPPRPRALTMPEPNATTEAETGTVATVINEEARGSGRWAKLFAQRLACLCLVAGVLLWAGGDEPREDQASAAVTSSAVR